MNIDSNSTDNKSGAPDLSDLISQMSMLSIDQQNLPRIINKIEQMSPQLGLNQSDV